MKWTQYEFTSTVGYVMQDVERYISGLSLVMYHILIIVLIYSMQWKWNYVIYRTTA